MIADSQQMQYCMYLSGTLVGGLLLNFFKRRWWSDSVAALVIGAYRVEQECGMALLVGMERRTQSHGQRSQFAYQPKKLSSSFPQTADKNSFAGSSLSK
jgi:hypothetical protein